MGLELGAWPRNASGLRMFKSGYRQNFRKSTSDCKCNHPQVCHYTREGNCVYQKCDCKEFSPKGRPEYSTAKRGTCSYGHSHDSGLEIKACFDLHCLKSVGEIRDFKFHEVLDLPGPSGSTIATYEMDFTVFHPGEITEYVECKGDHLMREMGWRLKWALLQDKHKGDPKYKFRVIRG